MTMLSDGPPPYVLPHTAWRNQVSAEDAEILTNASRTLEAMLDQSRAQDDGADHCFLSLWVGLLIGAGVVKHYAHAADWAAFVRYRTDDLCA